MFGLVLHILLLALGYRRPIGFQEDTTLSPTNNPRVTGCGVRARARAKGVRAHRNRKLCLNPRHCPTGFG